MDKHKYYFLVAFVIVLGIFLRFHNLDEFGTFGHDNSRDLILLYKLHVYKEWIFRGPVFSIVWAHLSPVYYYILFPVYLMLNFHPLAPAFFTSILNVSALVSIVFVGKNLFGRSSSAISAFVYAVSFLIIKEGAFGLNPTFLPLFSVLLFYSVYKIINGSTEYLYILSFCTAAMVSFHPSGFFTVPLLLILYFIYRPKFLLKEVSLSGVVFATFAVIPYAVQEKKFVGWDIKKVSEYFNNISGSGKELTAFAHIKNFTLIVLNNMNETLFPGSGIFGVILSAAILCMVLYWSFSFRRRKDPLVVLSFIIFAYLVAFGVSIKFGDVGLHEAWFQTVFIPLLVLFVGGALGKVRVRFSQYISAGLLAVVFLLNVKAYFSYTPERDTFYSQRLLSKVIYEDSDGRDFDIYGTDPEPINYLLWYYEENPSLRQKYYAWIKWSKKRDSNLAYFIQDKYMLTDGFKEMMARERGLTKVSKIYRYNDRTIYKFEQ